MAIPAAVKIAAAVMGNKKLRKSVGWILTAVLSPLILVAVLLCSIGSGGAEHNSTAIKLSFYGGGFSETVPAEFRSYISEMQSAFSILDSALASVNAQTKSGNGLDPIRVKAVFYALCFGGDAPSSRAAGQFVDCFYTWEVQTQTSTVANVDGTISTITESCTVVVPVSLETAYANLTSLLGSPVSEDDRRNITHIYTLIAGSDAGAYSGTYLPGGDGSIELDVSAFTNPTTKNAADLVTYAIHAWQSGWGYVWGTFGDVLTESLLRYKIDQYPEGVGNKESIIRSKWVGGRTADCVGLIKGYGWLDAETLAIRYGTNGMMDVSADGMYYAASVKGDISTIPDIPGLAVWHAGHIGVYIGNGEVIEAMGTSYGVVKTQLTERNWTAWLRVPYISYK